MLGKNYRVLEPIGIGGMAVVYLVEHQTLLKQFAAKVLSQQLASSLEARARFAQEAHAASQLDHENIVSISDFGVTIDHRPFFVMELLRGKTLDQRLAEGRMSIEEVVAIAVPVARALAHAHAEGIVHLDVKPENIFLVQRSQGRWGVKVVDFGIAKTPNNPRLTKIGETNGSPLFMAPEMCRGDDDVDRRADVYSFGILLYLMMCGRLPFVDDSLHRVLQMQLVQLPPPPREVNSELSPELAAIVERALAKNRDDRYPSMEALLADLAAALPPGADRLLIEAQSGTAVHETPFAGAMAIARTDSQRERIAAPPPPMFQSVLPRAPTRKRPLIISTAAIVTTLVGVLIWRQLASEPSATVSSRAATAAPSASTAAASLRAGERPARTAPIATPATTVPAPDVPASTSTAPAAPGPETASPGPETASPGPETASPAPADTIAVAPGAAASPPAGDPELVVHDTDEPATAPVGQRARPERTVVIGKVRPKGTFRPVPARPPRRPPVVAAATPQGAPAAAPVAEAPARAEPAPAPEAPSRPADAPSARQPEGSATAGKPSAPPDRPGAPITATRAAPAPAGPGSLNATPYFVSLSIEGPLSKAVVRRSIERTLSSLGSCYHNAARAAGATPAVELELRYEIDEHGLAKGVNASASFGSLGSCARAVASQIRTQEAPDVGTVQVTAVIGFRPL